MAVVSTGTAVQIFQEEYCMQCVHHNLFDGDIQVCPVSAVCLVGEPESGKFEGCEDPTELLKYIDRLFFVDETYGDLLFGDNTDKNFKKPICRMFIKKR